MKKKRALVLFSLITSRKEIDITGISLYLQRFHSGHFLLEGARDGDIWIWGKVYGTSALCPQTFCAVAVEA